jgi:hypothetical protein
MSQPAAMHETTGEYRRGTIISCPDDADAPTVQGA